MRKPIFQPYFLLKWLYFAEVAKLVDARDLKSRDSNVMWVRFPPAAQEIKFTQQQLLYKLFLLGDNIGKVRGVAQMARARGLGP